MPYNPNLIPQAPLPISMLPDAEPLTDNDLLLVTQPNNAQGRSRRLPVKKLKPGLYASLRTTSSMVINLPITAYTDGVNLGRVSGIKGTMLTIQYTNRLTNLSSLPFLGANKAVNFYIYVANPNTNYNLLVPCEYVSFSKSFSTTNIDMSTSFEQNSIEEPRIFVRCSFYLPEEATDDFVDLYFGVAGSYTDPVSVAFINKGNLLIHQQQVRTDSVNFSSEVWPE